MKLRVIFLIGCVLLAVAATARAGPEDAVVKIIAAPALPDPVRPWAKAAGAEGSGSGVIIDGKRILTNAHVVLYAPEVYVQARPGDEKIVATVQAVSRDVDLAVLTVKDERFFDKKTPLPRAEKLPRVQDPVTVYGFPVGGNDLSVTKGEISRIDFRAYSSGGVGMSIQISAPVNPGNSGGPAVVAGKMVGLVQSRLLGAQNISSIIPNEEIEDFLRDSKDGRYVGKAIDASETSYQTLENEALRRMLKVDRTLKGILVHPPRRPRVNYPLKADDIVTKIANHAIDDTGKVQLPNGLRAPFQYLIPKLAQADHVPLTVCRQGELLPISLPVTKHNEWLIPRYGGEPLAYFIHGPLVFAPGRADDVSLYASMNRNLYTENSPLVIRRFDFVKFPGEELVVVSAPMFQHKIAKGYGSPAGQVVATVNGVPIKSLRHLVTTLRDSRDAFLTFRFAGEATEVLVFDRQEMERATEEILEDHGIAAKRRGSPELLKVWQAKTPASP